MMVKNLKLNQASYKLLVENIQDYAIFLIDVDGIVLSWNRGAERIKGYKASEIIGKNIAVFYTPEDIENGIPQLNLRKAKELGQYEQEGWRVRKNGSLFWANVIITALNDGKGNLIGFSKVTRDLTKKKKAEEEIKRLNLDLEYLKSLIRTITSLG